jgi:hypothetical protein
VSDWATTAHSWPASPDRSMQLADFVTTPTIRPTRLACRYSGRFGIGIRLSENRGVPASSPGLAIRKPRGHRGFLLSGVRSSYIRVGHGLGPAARWVSRFERRTPITPRIRAGLEPLGRHNRGRYQYLRPLRRHRRGNRDLWATRARKVALKPAPRSPRRHAGKQAIGQIGPHDRPRRPPTSKRNPGNQFGVPPPARHPGNDVRAKRRALESSVAVAQRSAGLDWRVRGLSSDRCVAPGSRSGHQGARVGAR